MDRLAIISIALGILIILSRGPLIIAPAATREFYRRMFSTHLRIRVFGLGFLGLAAAMILVTRGDPRTGAMFFMALGWFFSLAAVLLLVFSWLFQLMAEAILDALDDTMARVLGVFMVLLGAFFIWLGAAVF